MRERGESLSDLERVKREALQDIEPDISGEDAPDLSALREAIKPRGRPRRDVNKLQVTVRYSPDVIARFRATGPGWQSRMDVALQDWLKDHDPRQIPA
jgi:uncharacterized protein (DUF4415 family)